MHSHLRFCSSPTTPRHSRQHRRMIPSSSGTRQPALARPRSWGITAKSARSRLLQPVHLSSPNIGTFILNSLSLSPTASTATLVLDISKVMPSSLLQHVNRWGIGLGEDDAWVTWGSQKVQWLLPIYQLGGVGYNSIDGGYRMLFRTSIAFSVLVHSRASHGARHS